mmetsp:Transcript_2847/g.9637  ORF Transcript_2847/g.9637 Transcript_2847/m.9637 type:complete len:323 (-) Transcript_2847:615-1583(-)
MACEAASREKRSTTMALAEAAAASFAEHEERSDRAAEMAARAVETRRHLGPCSASILSSSLCSWSRRSPTSLAAFPQLISTSDSFVTAARRACSPPALCTAVSAAARAVGRVSAPPARGLAPDSTAWSAWGRSRSKRRDWPRDTICSSLACSASILARAATEYASRMCWIATGTMRTNGSSHSAPGPPSALSSASNGSGLTMDLPGTAGSDAASGTGSQYTVVLSLTASPCAHSTLLSVSSYTRRSAGSARLESATARLSLLTPRPSRATCSPYSYAAACTSAAWNSARPSNRLRFQSTTVAHDASTRAAVRSARSMAAVRP